MKKYIPLIFSILLLAGFLVFFKPFSSQAQTTNSCPNYLCANGGLSGAKCCSSGQGVIQWLSNGFGSSSECSTDPRAITCASQGQVLQCDSAYVNSCTCKPAPTTNYCAGTPTPPNLPSPSIASPSPSIVPSPSVISSPPADNIRIFGQLFHGCNENQIEEIFFSSSPGIRIFFPDSDSNIPLGTADVKFDKDVLTYDLSFPRDGADYILKLEMPQSLESSYYEQEIKLTIPEGTKEINKNIQLQPKTILVFARTMTAKDFATTPNANVSLKSPLGSAITKRTNAHGEAIFEINDIPLGTTFPLKINLTAEGAYKGNPLKSESLEDEISTCLESNQIIWLYQRKECLTFNNLPFCFYGEEAIAWGKDPNAAETWKGIATQINDLGARAKYQNGVTSVRIISDLDNATADPFAKAISFGTPLIRGMTNNSVCLSVILTHEYGHLYHVNGLDLPDRWDEYWKQGLQLYSQKQIPMKEVFWKFKDLNYIGCIGGEAGHPQHGSSELFASSFMEMNWFRNPLKETILATTDLDIQNWSKKIYNDHVTTWAGGELLTKLKSLLAIK